MYFDQRVKLVVPVHLDQVEQVVLLVTMVIMDQADQVEQVVLLVLQVVLVHKDHKVVKA